MFVYIYTYNNNNKKERERKKDIQIITKINHWYKVGLYMIIKY